MKETIQCIHCGYINEFYKNGKLRLNCKYCNNPISEKDVLVEPDVAVPIVKEQYAEKVFREGHRKGWLRGADGHSGWENTDTKEFLKSQSKPIEHSLQDNEAVGFAEWLYDKYSRVDFIDNGKPMVRAWTENHVDANIPFTTKQLYEQYKQSCITVEQPDYELNFCKYCFQMTNHLNGVCQKCKPTEQVSEPVDVEKLADKYFKENNGGQLSVYTSWIEGYKAALQTNTPAIIGEGSTQYVHISLYNELLDKITAQNKSNIPAQQEAILFGEFILNNNYRSVDFMDNSKPKIKAWSTNHVDDNIVLTTEQLYQKFKNKKL